MDRITALVVIAHCRLRLSMIERWPHLLEEVDMIDIRRPIEIAGMASRLARAEKMERAIAATGQRYDQVLDRIDEKHAALQTHVGSLEQVDAKLGAVIDRMVAGSNGAPNGSGEASSQGSGEGEQRGGQVISSRTDAGSGA